MNKNIIIGIIVAVVVVAGGVYWLVQSGAGNMAPQPTKNLPPATPTSTPAQTSTPTQTPPPITTPPPAPLPMTHNVTIQNFAFNPASITVRAGDTVVWTNKDPMGHTITGNNGGPSSQTINANGTYSFTFNNVGTFDYHCSIHPSMKGTVIVTQ